MKSDATGFELPSSIAKLVEGRNELRAIYSTYGLEFTLDGNLVGDLGEAMAVHLFGIRLTDSNKTGIDGFAPDGRSVQVKATGTGRGPAFRNTKTRADQLIFLAFNFDQLQGHIVYNGPEAFALEDFPKSWNGQKSLTWAKIVQLDRRVQTPDRLPRKY